MAGGTSSYAEDNVLQQRTGLEKRLEKAINDRNVDEVRACIADNVNLESKKRGDETFLMSLAWYPDEWHDMMQVLIEGKANIDNGDVRGQTTLMKLVQMSNHSKMLNTLLAAKPDVFKKDNYGFDVFTSKYVLDSDDHNGYLNSLIKAAGPGVEWNQEALESRYQSIILTEKLDLERDAFIDMTKPDPGAWHDKYKKLNTKYNHAGEKTGERNPFEAADHVNDMIKTMTRGLLYAPWAQKIKANGKTDDVHEKTCGSSGQHYLDLVEQKLSGFITKTLFSPLEKENIPAIALPKLLEMSKRWDRNRARISRMVYDPNIEEKTDTKWRCLTDIVQGPNGYYLVPLTSCEMLDQESHALDHCVDGYKAECLYKAYQIYGVRKDPVLPEYTVGFTFDDKGRLERYYDPLGHENETATEKVHADCAWFEKNVQAGKWGSFNKKREFLLNKADIRRSNSNPIVVAAGYNVFAEDAMDRAEMIWSTWGTAMDDLLRYRKLPVTQVLKKGNFDSVFLNIWDSLDL